MKQRRKWFTATLLVALLGLAPWFAAAQTATTQTTSADLPVTRLALFTSGVGYFEHEGVVSGDQELVLTVPKAEMDDLLQSLVLQDFGGGTIEPVRYSSRAPLGRLLDGYSIDLSGNVTLVGLLAQARGERVRLHGPSVVEGALLGVEEQRNADGESSAFVTIATASGVRRVALADVASVEFLDPAVAAEIDEALATVAANRDDDTATVRLRFSGEGEREVRVSYVREMPVWKSTYRLVVGEDGVGTLQGWAIVDNPTDEALENVRVSFVAGQPVSFVTGLYDPVWADRPRVEVKASGGTVPGVDLGQAARALAEAVAPAPAAAYDAALLRPQDVSNLGALIQASGAGVSSQAEAMAGASSFAYHVSEPVTIGRNESALVPIVVAEVTAERVSLFHESNEPNHPLHAVRVVNDTGLQLAAGTVTVYDQIGFAGNARLPELLPGDERLLPYSVDLDLTLSFATGPTTTDVTRAAIRGSVIEVTELTRRTFTIDIAGAPAEGRFLIVQGPALEGFSVVAPVPEPPVSDGQPRFGVAVVGEDGRVPTDRSVPTHLVCRPGVACSLMVVAERVDSRSLTLANVATDLIGYYLENVELSDQDRATLELIATLQLELADADRGLQRTQGQIDVIFEEQQRIRANMGALDRNSDLYRRYVTELTEQEDALADLRRQQTEQQGERDTLQRRLNDLVSRLGG